MIQTNYNEIRDLYYEKEPTGSVDSLAALRTLFEDLQKELPTLPPPTSANLGDQSRLARFIKNLDFLRTHATPGLIQMAGDLLNWTPTLPSIPPPKSIPSIPSPSSLPSTATSNPTAIRKQKNPKSALQNPNPTSEPAANQPLPPKTPPGTNPEQTQNKTETTGNNPETNPAQTRNTPGTTTMQHTAHPQSNIDQLPPEIQEHIYNVIKSHGVRPAIRILEQPAPEGVSMTFAPSTLSRFQWRYIRRLAKEKKLIAREILMDEVNDLNRYSTPSEVAQAYLELRLTDSIFQPELPEQRLSRLLRDLNRIQGAKASKRRLELAEDRAFEASMKALTPKF